MGIKIWQIAMPCGLAVALACADSTLAGERLTIGQLHKYNTSYHMHSVTLVGKVEEMQVFPPMRAYAKRCYTYYGQAKFVLVDDTGSLQVENLGSCFPEAAQHLPHDGDRIELTAMIHAFVPQGQTTRVIKAITQEIIILK
jgi:hypothetical protein